jgi:hypothetical protein
MTYSGQGVNKKGVHAKHHAIIYSGKKPIAIRGEKEKGLTMKSIRVTPDNPRHKLDDASRLNYAKNYTVEYNVKVVSTHLYILPILSFACPLFGPASV